MLAKEIIEDSLLSFLSKEATNVDIDVEAGSQKVIILVSSQPISSFFILLFYFFPNLSFCVGVAQDKGWTVIFSFSG